MSGKTRSGKSYVIEKAILSKDHWVTHCSYCNGVDHHINKCNHDDIEKLHQEAIYATIFSHFILNTCQFLRIWLTDKINQELYVIGLKIGIGSYYSELRKKKDLWKFFNKIVHEYYTTEKYIPYSSTSNILYSIPDKIFIKFEKMTKRIFCDEKYKRVLMTIRVMMRQKKFNILVENIGSECNQLQSNDECPICYIVQTDTVMTNCGHLFCGECLSQHFKASNLNHCSYIICPYCRTPVSKVSVNNRDTFDIYQRKYIAYRPQEPPVPVPVPVPAPARQYEVTPQQNTILTRIYNLIGF
jgi:Zinc finger, C3HC4 type (RING finger)